MEADRQTDRQTDMQIAILYKVGKVITFRRVIRNFYLSKDVVTIPNIGCSKGFF